MPRRNSLRAAALRKKGQVTAEDFFAAPETKNRLSALASGLCQSRRIAVNFLDKNEEAAAYTDGSTVYINPWNPFAVGKKLEDKWIIVLGLLAHELGHVLWTDFDGFQKWSQALLNGQMLFSEPYSPELEKNKEELLKATTGPFGRSLVNLFAQIHNICEDGYLEPCSLILFPGVFKTGLNALRAEHWMSIQPINVQPGEKYSEIQMLMQLWLEYVKFGAIKQGNLPDSERVLKILEALIPEQDAMLANAGNRLENLNRSILIVWPIIKNELDEVQKMVDKMKQNGVGGLQGSSSVPRGSGKPIPISAEQLKKLLDAGVEIHSVPGQSGQSGESGESGQSSQNGQKGQSGSNPGSESGMKADGSGNKKGPSGSEADSEKTGNAGKSEKSGNKDSSKSLGNSGSEEGTEEGKVSSQKDGEKNTGNDAENGEENGDKGGDKTGENGDKGGDNGDKSSDSSDASGKDVCEAGVGSGQNSTSDGTTTGEADAAQREALRSMAGEVKVLDGNGRKVAAVKEILDETDAGAGVDFDVLRSQLEKKELSKSFEDRLRNAINDFAGSLDYGNAHAGREARIVRTKTVLAEREAEYKRIAPSLIPISKRLQRNIIDTLRDQQDGGRETGLYFGKKVNVPDVSKEMLGRGIFRKDILPEDIPRMAVALLIDQSGSMGGRRIEYARNTAIVIYDFCRALGIPVMVYGHNTCGSSDCTLYAHAEFDSIDGKDKYRLMEIESGGANRDGMALEYCAERLLDRPEEEKLLILISDGAPSADGYYGKEAMKDLSEKCRKYKKKKILFLAAGIGDDKEVLHEIYGSSFFDISDLSTMPKRLTAVIKKHLV